MKTFAILLCLTLTLPCGLRAAESLDQQFRNPPDSMKSYCYWYWLNGDITKEVHKGPKARNMEDEFSVKELLKPGENIIAIAVDHSIHL